MQRTLVIFAVVHRPTRRKTKRKYGHLLTAVSEIRVSLDVRPYLLLFGDSLRYDTFFFLVIYFGLSGSASGE